MPKKTKPSRKTTTQQFQAVDTANAETRTYEIPDYRLERPNFTVRQVRKGDEVRYEVTGDVSAPFLRFASPNI